MNTEGLTEATVDVTVPEALPVVEPSIEVVPVVVETPQPVLPALVVPNLDDSSLYIHRELSQLQFNIRVLEQALDESYPLLERLKFLPIFSSNPMSSSKFVSPVSRSRSPLLANRLALTVCNRIRPWPASASWCMDT